MCVCVSDFCQVELRLLAHLSSDPELLRIFINPQADVFTMLASQWWVSHTNTRSVFSLAKMSVDAPQDFRLPLSPSDCWLPRSQMLITMLP